MKPEPLIARPLTFAHLPATAALLWGLTLAVYRAQGPEGFFWENVAFYWLPQMLVLGLLLVTRPPRALFTGIALALAVHLQAFSLWITSSIDVMGWLFYLFDFPGALIGAGVARYWAYRNAPSNPAITTLLGFGWVMVGLLVNLALVGLSQQI